MLRMLLAALLLVSILSGAAAICSPSSAQAVPSATTSPQVRDGEQIFQQNCTQCHAVHEGQYSFGPNLDGEMKKSHPKKTAPEIREILKNGKGKMPAFGEKLNASAMDHLIAYMRTL